MYSIDIHLSAVLLKSYINQSGDKNGDICVKYASGSECEFKVVKIATTEDFFVKTKNWTHKYMLILMHRMLTAIRSDRQTDRQKQSEIH